MNLQQELMYAYLGYGDNECSCDSCCYTDELIYRPPVSDDVVKELSREYVVAKKLWDNNYSNDVMVFRRFSPLYVGTEVNGAEKDVLTQSFLGECDFSFGYFPQLKRIIRNDVILNDEWIVNLKSKTKG